MKTHYKVIQYKNKFEEYYIIKYKQFLFWHTYKDDIDVIRFKTKETAIKVISIWNEQDYNTTKKEVYNTLKSNNGSR